jgi:hypothetical protein
METALEQVAAQSDHVFVIKDVIAFPAEQMQSADHTLLGAAEVYTQKLAEAIESIRTAQR